jgi:hypothetical protein
MASEKEEGRPEPRAIESDDKTWEDSKKLTTGPQKAQYARMMLLADRFNRVLALIPAQLR